MTQRSGTSSVAGVSSPSPTQGHHLAVWTPLPEVLSSRQTLPQLSSVAAGLGHCRGFWKTLKHRSALSPLSKTIMDLGKEKNKVWPPSITAHDCCFSACTSSSQKLVRLSAPTSCSGKGAELGVPKYPLLAGRCWRLWSLLSRLQSHTQEVAFGSLSRDLVFV